MSHNIDDVLYLLTTPGRVQSAKMQKAKEDVEYDSAKALERFARKTPRGYIVDPDGRATFFKTADEALDEIVWLLEATDIASDY